MLVYDAMTDVVLSVGPAFASSDWSLDGPRTRLRGAGFAIWWSWTGLT